MTTPFDQLDESEVALRASLVTLDTAHAAEMVTIDEDVAQRQADAATAGSQYDDAISDAETEAASELSDYADFLAELQSEVDAVGDASDDIADIEAYSTLSTPGSAGGVGTPGSVPTGTPDVAAADVTTAIQSLASAVNASISSVNSNLASAITDANAKLVTQGNTVLGEIKDVLTLLNDAIQALKALAQTITSAYPPATDSSETDKAAANAEIEGAFP